MSNNVVATKKKNIPMCTLILFEGGHSERHFEPSLQDQAPKLSSKYRYPYRWQLKTFELLFYESIRTIYFCYVVEDFKIVYSVDFNFITALLDSFLNLSDTFCPNSLQVRLD